MKIGPIDLFKSLISYIVAFVLVVHVPQLFREMENAFFPVAKNMTITSHRWVDGNFIVGVVGLKNRDCNIARGPEGFAIIDDLLVKVPISFPNDPSPGSSRPTGWQSFGDWAFDLSGYPNAQSVIAYVWHNCSSFYQTETVIGPWPVLRREAP